jgi:hypothetical protein
MALMLTLELRRKPLMWRLGSLQTCVQTGQEDRTPGNDAALSLAE